MATKTTKLAKSAFDCKHVKSVSAWVIMLGQEMAGRIVADWSDNPMGSVCRATVHVWNGPMREMENTTGTAGGYGYCKFSAAVSDALSRVLPKDEQPQGMHGAGESAVQKFFEDNGYKLHRII